MVVYHIENSKDIDVIVSKVDFGDKITGLKLGKANLLLPSIEKNMAQRKGIFQKLKFVFTQKHELCLASRW